MVKKKLSSLSALVYSTDPGYNLQESKHDNVTTLPAEHQKLKVSIDKKQRAGKVVTLIIGFAGREEDVQQLCRQLKTVCGTGGSVKNGDIIIQGDNKEKVFQWFQKSGYKQVKKL